MFHLKQERCGGYSSTGTFVLIPLPSVIGLNIRICPLFMLLLEVVEAVTQTHFRQDLIIFITLLYSLPTMPFVFAYSVCSLCQGCHAYLKKQPKKSKVLEFVRSTSLPCTVFFFGFFLPKLWELLHNCIELLKKYTMEYTIIWHH